MNKKVFPVLFLFLGLAVAAVEYENQNSAIPLKQDAYFFHQDIKNEIPTNTVQGVVIGKRAADNTLLEGYFGNAKVLYAEDLNNTNAKTLPDLLEQEAGIVFFNQNGSIADQSLNFRGFNQGEEVTVIVDGIKYNEADQNDVYWSTIPLQDIEKIEIIKGSQSAVYGSGAMAGVINIITKKSGNNSLTLKSGSYGFGQQIVNFSHSWDKFFIQLNGDYQKNSGYRDKSNLSVENTSFKIGWRDHGQQINYYYKKFNSSLKYADSLTEEELAADRSEASPAYDKRIIDGALANLELISKINDDWQYSLNFSQKNRKVNYYGIARGAFGTNYTKSINYSDEALWQVNYRDKLIFGYDYRISNIHSREYDLDKTSWQIGQKTDDKNSTKGEYAPYLQLFENFNQFYLRYGAREDKVDYVTYDNLNNILKSGKNFTQRTHGGELGYKVAKNISLYYSYGEAFKAPTFYDLYGPWGAGNEDLTPELARTNEIGLRIIAENYDFNYSVFQTIVADEIISNASWVNENMQKTKRDGYELSISQKIGQNLKWFSNFSYVKARFVEAEPAGTDVSGYSIPMVPEKNYSIGMTYLMGQYSITMVHNFVDQQYVQSDNYNEYPVLPAYNFTNLKLRYFYNENLEFNLGISNLFNKLYCTRAVLGGTTVYYNPADVRTGEAGCKLLF